MIVDLSTSPNRPIYFKSATPSIQHIAWNQNVYWWIKKCNTELHYWRNYSQEWEKKCQFPYIWRHCRLYLSSPWLPCATKNTVDRNCWPFTSGCTAPCCLTAWRGCGMSRSLVYLTGGGSSPHEQRGQNERSSFPSDVYTRQQALLLGLQWKRSNGGL